MIHVVTWMTGHHEGSCDAPTEGGVTLVRHHGPNDCGVVGAGRRAGASSDVRALLTNPLNNT